MRRLTAAVLPIVAVGAALGMHACGTPSGTGPGGSDAADDSTASCNATTDGEAIEASALPLPPQATDVPLIPVGFDAYKQWDRWPYLRLGMRASMRSTYDRAGQNEGADASHFLRLTSDRAIALDLAGPGVLYFTRANHWHGSPWHDVVDGTDITVGETNTATPNAATTPASFIPQTAFPPPLALNWPTTQGADVSGVPIGFTRSYQLGYERTHYGTGYFIFDSFPQGADNLSQPIVPWSAGAPDPAVLALLSSAGQDIAPMPPTAQAFGGTIALTPGTPTTVFDTTGPAMLRALTLTVPIADAESLGASRLRVTWDGRSTPSIDAPVSLFFGAGSMLNRNNREYLVQALPVSIHFVSGTVTFAVYFPMPFFRSAHVELVGASAVAAVSWAARTVPYTDPTNWVGYFHATYVDQGTPTPGVDLVMLDTTKVEGGGDWCGHVVGTSFIFSEAAYLATLEGDPRFFFDDSQTPQVQGTGSEEWGGGGDDWGGLQTTLPLFGHPVGAPNVATAMNAEDQIESEYRFLLADVMPFGKNARMQLEHGGIDETMEHYRTIAYWYGLPGACLVPTDSLHVSDRVDEAAHLYASPCASTVDTVTSRYEWGVDHFMGAEIYPATTDTGRHTTGTSEFTLALDPDNVGALLRRKLDYAFPDQRAEVYVADASGAASAQDFVDAGTWYLAGSNTCIYSNPPGELDPPTRPDGGPITETSNRQWRDDEFLLPRALTRGRTAIRVRLVFTPANQPILPGAPLATQAWSEYRYSAYVWKLPPPG
jgi:hypothetical protein